MPVPMSTTTPLRQQHAVSPPSTTGTPIRQTSRSTSNYSAYTPTITPVAGATKLNIVTRVALEGKARHGDDGGSIKMYLKFSIPLDSVTPGTTIPLFPEENVKILSSQVHPLDNNSVPYNFSSTVSPLLHRAAAALNLPARSLETFDSAFGIRQPHNSASSSRTSSNSDMIPPVDEAHSGHILVSGYSISYVLPRGFPTQPSEYDEGVYSRPTRSRRLSISERNTSQFMAAIDMWVPYVSRPPRSPFLLSIPTPRCLHNHIRLRIFPPNPTSNSYASLSSIEDEGGSWDLTADPNVTRSLSNRLARSNSYNNLADDESSDSSISGFADGCGIQGTFPSAERIRIRWAKPSKSFHVPGGGRDGRRRVGVKSVKGEMACVVRGRAYTADGLQPEGILMDVEYKGTCSGVWFPGVATLLGMDVGLEAKGSEISWAEGAPPQWTINGGNGYTGFDVGPSTAVPAQSRASSFESNSSAGKAGEDPSNSKGFLNGLPQASRSSSTSSTSSLLRAPLPTTNVVDYSFEGSNSSLGSNGSYTSPPGTNSIPSLSVSAPGGQPAQPQPPGLPITLHLNINDLLPPAKNVFTFTISGTVIITPKIPLSRLNGTSAGVSFSGDTKLNADPITLPKFTVLAADSESTMTSVRHEVEAPNSVIEVYRPTGDIYKDAQAKKTVLRLGGFTKCGEEGGRIALKCHDPFKHANGSNITTPSGLPRTPLVRRSSKASTVAPSPGTPDALSIPRISAVISPLARAGSSSVEYYAVTLKLPIPIQEDSGWLEFGLAAVNQKANADKATSPKSVKVRVVSATIEGVATRVETSDGNLGTSGADFETVTGREWVNWVKVDVASQQGQLVLEYVAKSSARDKKGKGKASNDILDILLPTFPVPVGKLDVKFDSDLDLVFSVLETNFDLHITGSNTPRMVHYRLPEFFYPRLVLRAEPKVVHNHSKYFPVSWALILLGFLVTAILGNRPSISSAIDSLPILEPSESTSIFTTTVTTTVYPSFTSASWQEAISQTAVPSEMIDPTPQISPEVTVSKEVHQLSEASPSLTPLTKAALSTLSTSSENPLSSPSPNLSPSFELGLEFFSKLQFPWMNRDSADWNETYQTVRRGLAILWRYLRKAYHYPLEAP